MIGIAGDADVRGLAPALEPLLGVRFEERESGNYADGAYYLAEPGGREELRLYRNHDPLDGTPFFDGDAAVLLRLFSTPRDPEQLAAAIRERLDRDARVLRVA